ncbi:hypothetical protein LINGRAHAP2_LOCUS2793 [Linum grandiflorum]
MLQLVVLLTFSAVTYHTEM